MGKSGNCTFHREMKRNAMRGLVVIRCVAKDAESYYGVVTC
jgi:hypothetical protein